MANKVSKIKNLTEPKTIMAFVFFVFISVFTWMVVEPYAITVMLSVVYCLLVWPLYKLFAYKRKWKEILATLMVLFITIVAIAIPLVILAIILVGALGDTIESVQKAIATKAFADMFNSLNTLLNDLSSGKFNISLESISDSVGNLIKGFGNILINSLVYLGTASISLVTNIIIFLILVFALLPRLRDLRIYIESISPFNKSATTKYINRSSHLIVDVIKGSFVIAFAQGLAGGLMLWILGVNNLAVLTFLMMIVSVIPMLGTGLVTVPMAVIMLIQGDIVSAIVLLVWQILVIGNVDTLLRPKLVSKESEMPQAIMLIAVLGGMKAFGLIGLIIGPIVLILFLTSLEVYNSDYK